MDIHRRFGLQMPQFCGHDNYLNDSPHAMRASEFQVPLVFLFFREVEAKQWQQCYPKNAHAFSMCLRLRTHMWCFSCRINFGLP